MSDFWPEELQNDQDAINQKLSTEVFDIRIKSGFDHTEISADQLVVEVLPIEPDGQEVENATLIESERDIQVKILESQLIDFYAWKSSARRKIELIKAYGQIQLIKRIIELTASMTSFEQQSYIDRSSFIKGAGGRRLR
jgi:hypothetical protein